MVLPLYNGPSIVVNTYADGHTWANPFATGPNATIYRVPDSMIAQTAAESTQINFTSVLDDVADVQQTWTQTTSWSSGFLGMCSNSKTVTHFLDHFYQHDEALAMSSLSVKYVKLTMPIFPPPKFHHLFLESLEGLPTEVNNHTYRFYKAFFGSYGLALVDSAHLGGHMKAKRWFDRCFLHTESKVWVTEQSSWSFLGICGGGHGHQSENAHISKKFLNESHFSMEYLGGNSSGLRPDQWQSWIPTIADSMLAVDFTLQPLHTVVGLTHPDIAANLKKAMHIYLTESQTAMDKREAAARAKYPPNPNRCHHHGQQ